ncbi:MAG TPA: HDIG domain-containing protein [bacterium]|nr:HDIG domain-containing protein [bacterium]
MFNRYRLLTGETIAGTTVGGDGAASGGHSGKKGDILSEDRNDATTGKSIPRLVAAKSIVARFRARHLLLIVLLSAIISVILSPSLIGRTPRYRLGDFVIGNIRAPFDISVADPLATEEARTKALTRLEPIYEYDTSARGSSQERVQSAFKTMHKLFMPLAEVERLNLASKKKAQRQAELDRELKIQLVDARGEFQKQMATELSDDEYDLLIAARFAPVLAERINAALSKVYSHYITFDFDEISAILINPEKDGPTAIRIRERGQSSEQTLKDMARVINPKQAELIVLELAEKQWQAQTKAMKELLAKIAVNQIKPNLVRDNKATEEARRRAVEAVLPVAYTFKKNQLIIGDGQAVEQQQKVVLDYLRQQSAPKGWIKTMFGLMLLSLLTLTLSFRITDANMRRFVISERDTFMLGILLVCTLLGLRLTGWFGDKLTAQFPTMPTYLLVFLFPLATPTMLVRFLLRFEIAAIFAVVVAAFAALAIQAPLHYFALAFVISLVGAHVMRDVKRRSQVLRGGLIVGLVAMTSAYVLMMLVPQETNADFIFTPLAGFIGGVLAGVLVLGLAPLFENVMGYMTDISLLELANYENPLLRRISHYASGTFHHSIAISSLAEAAAEAISANALLVRVGALYHDLGKSINPRYFVENQLGDNPHDREKSPRDSAQIIKAHVIEGAKLARENKLPQRIVDFIEQHHGTRTIAYFLDRAQKAAAAGGEPVVEADYRYPGPKPQTRETAILMICDVVEARSRTITDRDESKVRAMIDEMIQRLVDEGELNECPLRIGDLPRISQALTEVIIGMRHNRIAYPDQKKFSQRRN